jgi:hypothetical protein
MMSFLKGGVVPGKFFSGTIHIIGINPFVTPPAPVLEELFRQARKTQGPIPVRGRLNGKVFTQTLVKYRGLWRLYLNTQMRKDAGVGVGDRATVVIEFDPSPRVTPMHPKLAQALSKNPAAKAAFSRHPPSHQREILRYLHSLKSTDAIERNVEKVVAQLAGGHLKATNARARRKLDKPAQAERRLLAQVRDS